MNSKGLIEEIRSYCLANANEANVIKYSRYFKGGFNAYGLANGQVESKVKDLLQDKTITIPLILQAASELVKSEMYEETGFALLMLNHRKKQYSHEVFKAIEFWFAFGIRNWAHADMLGMWILPDLVKQKVVAIEDFRPWLTSEYKFQRRCVPVTLIKSLKTTVDISELFGFIEPLMTDPEREVHQGAGWFLREGWKINREVTEKYLMKHKNTAPRLIIQYATEKMSKEERLKFRKEK
ncbi:MAG: DNA alkylation repair protein [Porphyromonadaceae bacterium]|nr:MAG: DNA alkylation repair protein [Porphyromonadaceae bacterium]